MFIIEGLDFEEMQSKTMRLIMKTNITSDKWKILKNVQEDHVKNNC